MKLTEYIEKQRREDFAKQEDDKRNRITENVAKEDFRKNFTHSVLNVVGNQLDQLSYQIGDFSAKETKREMTEFPYVVYYTIEISINHQIAQYFLEITGNFHIYHEGVTFKFESAGYARALETENISFEDLDKFDVEQYLTKSMMEFKEND